MPWYVPVNFCLKGLRFQIGLEFSVKHEVFPRSQRVVKDAVLGTETNKLWGGAEISPDVMTKNPCSAGRGFHHSRQHVAEIKTFCTLLLPKMSGSVITYMVVDFPAPLWPNKAVTSPRRNSMVRSLTAVLVTPLDSLKTLVKFSRRTPSKLW